MLFVVVVWFCAAASLYVGSGLLVLNYVSDEGLRCPVVVIATDPEEESSAHLWWALVVLTVGHPHRMHLAAGTCRSSHQVVGLRPA